MEVDGTPAEVWRLFWYRGPRPKTDGPVQIDILHPGDEVGEGLIRHCTFPVPKYLLSGGVGHSWEWLTEVRPTESWKYDAVGKPLWSRAEGRTRLEDLGDGRTRLHFTETYHAFNPVLRALLERRVHRFISRDNDRLITSSVNNGLRAARAARAARSAPEPEPAGAGAGAGAAPIPRGRSVSRRVRGARGRRSVERAAGRRSSRPAGRLPLRRVCARRRGDLRDRPHRRAGGASERRGATEGRRAHRRPARERVGRRVGSEPHQGHPRGPRTQHGPDGRAGRALGHRCAGPPFQRLGHRAGDGQRRLPRPVGRRRHRRGRHEPPCHVRRAWVDDDRRRHGGMERPGRRRRCRRAGADRLLLRRPRGGAHHPRRLHGDTVVRRQGHGRRARCLGTRVR